MEDRDAFCAACGVHLAPAEDTCCSDCYRFYPYLHGKDRAEVRLLVWLFYGDIVVCPLETPVQAKEEMVARFLTMRRESGRDGGYGIATVVAKRLGLDIKRVPSILRTIAP